MCQDKRGQKPLAARSILYSSIGKPPTAVCDWFEMVLRNYLQHETAMDQNGSSLFCMGDIPEITRNLLLYRLLPNRLAVLREKRVLRQRQVGLYFNHFTETEPKKKDK
jgi:hypothetical protein